MRRILLALSLFLPLAVAATGNNIDKISDDIHVAAGQHAGDLSTVSGDVDIGARAVVGNAGTVSGSMSLGSHAQAGGLSTVSGDIYIAADAVATGSASTVSGHIHLAQDAQVQGHLSTVGGAITLDDAQVGGGIETVNGDITVGANSRVEGGILVYRPEEHGDHTTLITLLDKQFHVQSTPPTIVIGPHAVVQGTLVFRHPVVLDVSDSAQIGPVEGATVKRFSGATP